MNTTRVPVQAFSAALLLLLAPASPARALIDIPLDMAPSSHEPSISCVVHPTECYQYLAYLGPNRQVRYCVHEAQCNEVDGLWDIDSTLTRYGSEVALAMTLSSATPHIVIASTGSDSNWVTYATRSGGSWQYQAVLAQSSGDSVASIPSVSIGEWNGNPYIAYVVHRNDGYEFVRYATRSGSTWSSTNVIAADAILYPVALRMYGSTPSLAYRVEDGVNVPYVYYTQRTSSWSTPEQVHYSSQAFDLAMSGGGVPHVATSDGSSIYHSVRGSGGSWTHTVASYGNATERLSLAIALDPAGTVHMCYYDHSDHTYYYVYHHNSSTWQTAYMIDAGSGSSSEPVVSFGVGKVSSVRYPRLAYFMRPYGRMVHGGEAFISSSGLGSELSMRTVEREITPPEKGWSVSPSGHRAGGAVEFRLEMAETGVAELNLYDAAGRLVAKRPADALAAGSQRLVWDLGPLRAGLYFVMLRTGGAPRAVARWAVLE